MNQFKSRNRVIILLSVTAIVVFIFAAIAFLILSKYSNGSSIIRLNSDNAVDLALKNADLDRKDISMLECELDLDGLETKYEIDFISSGSIYEYEISAYDGRILSKKKK